MKVTSRRIIELQLLPSPSSSPIVVLTESAQESTSKVAVAMMML